MATQRGDSELHDRTVIFQHVPKAAGSTVRSILERQYRPEEIYNVTGPAGIRETALANLPVEIRARKRLIQGHLYFGVHRLLPNPSTYVTILRHPVERIVSHYNYVKRSPQHYLHERVMTADMSLEAYVTSGISLELNNGQVRSLYGPEHEMVGYGECSRAMLEQALDNLETCYAVAGLAERFDETLLLMRHHLGWNSLPFYVRKNVSRNRLPTSSVPARVLDLIAQHNALDMELYAAASKAFARLVEDQQIRTELARFRLMNRIYAGSSNSARATRRAMKRFCGQQ